MERKEFLEEDWDWFFTGSSNDEEATLGQVWIAGIQMVQEVIKRDKNAKICLFVSSHEGARPHAHGCLKTGLGQAVLSPLWRQNGNTKFKRFEKGLAMDLWEYIQWQKVGDPITEKNGVGVWML